MLMTKKKILATLVATTLVISTIMPNVALALDTVEETEPTTVTTTETEPAVTEPTTVPETSETSAQPAETTEESKATEETTSETTATESTPSDISEPSESSEDPAPSTSETTVEATKPTESSVDTSEPAEEVTFNQSKTIDGIKITVEADKGVFPEGAELKVIKINKVAINKEDNLVASMTFDISIMLDGKEIEPDTTKGEVKVTFFDERFADKNLDAAIYHTSDDKKTEEMNIETIEGGAQVTTDGFSLYTVEFTYGDMQYTIQGNSAVALSTILEKVGLEGEVTDVEISNSELFKYEDGNIFALKAFTSKEWMKVTINGITYIIIVTDDPDNPEDATAGVDAYAVLYSDGTLAFQKGEEPIAAYGDNVNSWLIPADWDNSETEDIVERAPWINNTDITKVIFVDNIKGITTLNNYFYNLENLTEVQNASRLDISTVTNVNSMFRGCSSLTTLDISGWDLSAASSLGPFVSGMFSGDSNLKTINMSGWTHLPADCSNIFGRYCGLDGTKMTLNVTNWDVTSVTNMNGLFCSSSVETIIGLETWNTKNVTSMEQMFAGSSNLKNFDYTHFNTSKVTTISQMFQSVKLDTLDLSNWDTSSLTIFGNGTLCAAKTLILDGLDLSHVNQFGGALGGSGVETISMKGTKISNNWANSNGFGRAMGAGNTLKTIDVTNLDISECTTISTFFANLPKLTTITGLTTWNTSNVTDFSALHQ